jgi:putative PIN family toxin of toxin-antitoxin system
MIAILDTNVLVSGLIAASGPPGRLVDLIRAGRLTAVVDDRILEEYEDVLRRDSLQRYFMEAEVENILDYLRHAACRVVCTIRVTGLPDPGDVPFLETALAAGAPLVTGNKRHFPESKRGGCRVLSPAEFLDHFESTV